MAGARTVVTPRGREWTVKRRWTLPGVKGTAGRPVAPLDASRGLGAGGVFGGLAHLGVEHLLLAYLVGVAVLAVFGVLIAVAFALSIVVVLLVAVVLGALLVTGFLGRALLGRPWLVEARSGGQALAWHVQGYGHAGRVVDQLADAIERGNEQPAAHGAERVLLG